MSNKLKFSNFEHGFLYPPKNCFTLWHPLNKDLNFSNTFPSFLIDRGITSSIYNINPNLSYFNDQMAQLTFRFNKQNLLLDGKIYSQYEIYEIKFVLLKLLFYVMMHFLSRKKKAVHLIFLVIGVSKLLLFYTSLFKTFSTEKLKSIQTDHFFSNEVLDLFDWINAAENDKNLILLTVHKIKISHYPSFYRLIILLSGDVNPNPGPAPGPCQLNPL